MVSKGPSELLRPEEGLRHNLDAMSPFLGFGHQLRALSVSRPLPSLVGLYATPSRCIRLSAIRVLVDGAARVAPIDCRDRCSRK